MLTNYFRKVILDRLSFYCQHRQHYSKVVSKLQNLDFCITQDLSDESLQEFNLLFKDLINYFTNLTFMHENRF